MTERNNEIPLSVCVVVLEVSSYLISCELKKNSYFWRSIFHERLHISYPINNFKILLKSSHNIESVLFFFNFSVTQVTSQPYSIHSISVRSGQDMLSAIRTCLKRPLQKKKVTWRCKHNPNNQFFYLTKRKNIYALNSWNNRFILWFIAKW